MAQAYPFPLKWPVGVARTKHRQAARFFTVTKHYNGQYTRNVRREKTIKAALNSLAEELERLGATYVVVSTNVELKPNGDPYSGRKDPDDPGVAVYFSVVQREYCMPCDRWNSVADNLHAVAKHLEALRGQMRWGVASVEQAFAGFKALPENVPVRRSCFEVLGVEPGATEEEIRKAHREAVKALHPDVGGDAAAMAEVNAARDEALRAVVR